MAPSPCDDGDDAGRQREQQDQANDGKTGSARDKQAKARHKFAGRKSCGRRVGHRSSSFEARHVESHTERSLCSGNGIAALRRHHRSEYRRPLAGRQLGARMPSGPLTLDIVACGDGWCGIKVEAGDKCGGTALKIDAGEALPDSDYIQFKGTLQLAPAPSRTSSRRRSSCRCPTTRRRAAEAADHRRHRRRVPRLPPLVPVRGADGAHQGRRLPGAADGLVAAVGHRQQRGSSC